MEKIVASPDVEAESSGAGGKRKALESEDAPDPKRRVEVDLSDSGTESESDVDILGADSAFGTRDSVAAGHVGVGVLEGSEVEKSIEVSGSRGDSEKVTSGGADSSEPKQRASAGRWSLVIRWHRQGQC